MEHAALAVGRRAHAGAPVEFLPAVVPAGDVPSLEAPDIVAASRGVCQVPQHHKPGEEEDEGE